MSGKIAELYIYDRAVDAEIIAGVDEAGRGPLAGPVVAAACIMPLDDIIEGINDSKQLSKKKREELYERIIHKAVSYSCVSVDHNVIDEINILEATRRAMKECIEKLSINPSLILTDAVKLNIKFPQKNIIHGDATSYNIAAASIIAKVTRDRMMREYDKIYPEYSFKDNKGYGTAAHIEAIKKIGPCGIHRLSFIRNFTGGERQMANDKLQITNADDLAHGL